MPAEKLDGSLLIASPVGSGNALGRALALADLAAETVDDVTVVAPEDGPLWPAASRWKHRVERHAGRSALPSGVDPGKVSWVWMVKPLRESWRAACAVASANPDAALILDFDDDDEALAREFAAASLTNRLRLHPFRQLNPSRIAGTRHAALARADAVTVASRAVASRLVPRRDTVRIPHPRAVASSVRSRSRPADGTKHVGFFGTVRGHKGVERLVSMLDLDSSVRLHVFTGSQMEWPDDPQRIIEHPLNENYEQLFSNVDAVVLPQKTTPGGDVQLPAKLLDAMRLGVPVITTPTAAIRETAGETAFYVEDWSDPDEVSATLARCLRDGERVGSASRERFERELSQEAIAPRFRELLTNLARAKALGKWTERH